MQDGYLRDTWQKDDKADVDAAWMHIEQYKVPTHIACISNNHEYAIMCISEDPQG